ncbi:IclR family transcriptional regulator [Oceanicola sp. 22II-s10i]|uniref:IclR family transcriptional regulator n=1 Tax=Oceanicola sp. 22II-s10i TaxID=1317116 RepID=UPI000B52512A|nr:helix-turn-helix domain-containing protein [Oceanicola sp. 22II-s10i]
MVDEQNTQFVPAVQNATRILRLIAASGRPQGATEIARQSGLSVSSVFKILRTLHQEGLITFDADEKTYGVAMGLLEFAIPLIGSSPGDLIRPALSAIAHDHGVMIALWQITQDDRIVLTDRFVAPGTVQVVIAPNSRLPVFAGATGRCYAAALGLDKAAARRGYDTIRWQGAPGFESYWQDVIAARDSGSAQDRGHLFRGLDMVAALACDATQVPRLAMSSITIAGQHSDDGLAKVGQTLADVAARIEHIVFGRPRSGPTTVDEREETECQ